MGEDDVEGEHTVREKELSWEAMGVIDKLKYVVTNVTIEPILFFLVLPSTLSALAIQNLYIEKACRINLNYSEELCNQLMRGDNTNETESIVKEVQIQVSLMQTWKAVITYLPPAVLILFLGSWSDRHARRKPFILLPIAGDICTNLSFLLCTYYLTEIPIEAVAVMEAVFPALSGGLFTMLMGVFSYIADITSLETRTQRIGIANIFVSVCTPVGSALSGVITKYLGYYGAFSISLALTVTGFTYCLFRVKEAKPPVPAPSGVAFFQDLFDYHHIQDTFQVGFKKREGNRRKWIILLIILSVLIVGPIAGEASNAYYFTFERFTWREVDFSLYATCGGIVSFIGTTIGVTLFVKMLKLSDGILGVIGCVGKILSSLTVCFSSQSWMLYLGLALDFFGGMTLLALRALGSKIVPCNEQGKLNSLFGVFESLAPVVYSSLYNSVYAATVRTFIGAVYFMSAMFTIPIAVVFMLMRHMTPLDTEEGKDVIKLSTAPSIPKYRSRSQLELDQCNTNSGFENDNNDGCKKESVKESNKL